MSHSDTKQVDRLIISQYYTTFVVLIGGHCKETGLDKMVGVSLLNLIQPFYIYV